MEEHGADDHLLQHEAAKGHFLSKRAKSWMTNIGVARPPSSIPFRFGLKWNEAILGFFKIGWLWKFSCPLRQEIFHSHTSLKNPNMASYLNFRKETLAFKDFCSHKEFEKRTQLRRTTRTEINAGQSRQDEVCPSKNRQAAAARGSRGETKITRKFPAVAAWQHCRVRVYHEFWNYSDGRGPTCWSDINCRVKYAEPGFSKALQQLW